MREYPAPGALKRAAPHVRDTLRRTVTVPLRFVSTAVMTTVLRPLRWVLQRNHATVLIYHDPRPEVLDAHLTLLRRRGYAFIPLAAWAGAMERRSTEGLPRRCLVVTIDDGWRGNHALREVLERHACPATIFLCAGLVDTGRTVWDFVIPVRDRRLNSALKSVSNRNRVEVMREVFGVSPETELPERVMLTHDEIRAMREVVDFQSHGMLHPPLPTCSDEELLEELAGSRRRLEQVLERPVTAFAYPYGDFGERERRAAGAAGYRIARTARCGLASVTDDPLALPAVGIDDHDTPPQLDRRLAWAELRTMARKLREAVAATKTGA